MARALMLVLVLLLSSLVAPSAVAVVPDCSALTGSVACEHNEDGCRTTSLGPGAVQGYRCEGAGYSVECVNAAALIVALVEWCRHSGSPSATIWVAGAVRWDQQGCWVATVNVRCNGFLATPDPGMLGLSQRWGDLLP